jgi:regulatory protein
MMPRRIVRPPVPPAPDRSRLQEAALAHLARYAATRAGLIRVLDRKIDRWARAATAERPDASDETAAAVEAARVDARALVDRLVSAGAVDDAAFAATRARRLTREGKSRVAVSAHLTAKGVPPAVTADVLPDDEEYEVGAALSLARRRRLGPFRRTSEIDAAGRMHEMSVIARGGFSRAIAERALAMTLDEAEDFLRRLRES